jgi:hypothetical protein
VNSEPWFLRESESIIIMKFPRIPIIVIILVFIIVAGFAFSVSLNPGGFGNLITVDSDNKPPKEVLDSLDEKLNSGNRMELAFPFKTIYSPGEVFEATLGIINLLNEDSNFYIDIVQESGPENGPLLVYKKETGLIKPREGKKIDIGVISYPSTPEGIYSYSVLVCLKPSCTGDSPDLYSSREMSYRIM